MGVMKRRHAAGERAQPIAGCAGMYQMSDQPGAFHWAGLGPCPHFAFAAARRAPTGGTMIFRPKPGQRVKLLYSKSLAPSMPHHGKMGTVLESARGPGPGPRSVIVDLGTAIVIVPRGNLTPVN